MAERARILIVGGRDPSGAGVDADREALAGLALEADVVVTADTEQDDRELRSIGARAVERWTAQARAACASVPAAVKFGLLPGREHVLAAAELVAELRERAGDGLPVVVDPVLAASSGGRFLDAAAVRAIVEVLLARAPILTPNLLETAELTGLAPARLQASFEARIEGARRLCDRGARAVVVKGGHAAEDPALDLLLERAGRPVWLAHPRVRGGSLRGSGCRHATRLAAELALGRGLEAAARAAGEHVAARIAAAAS